MTQLQGYEIAGPSQCARCLTLGTCAPRLHTSAFWAAVFWAPWWAALIFFFPEAQPCWSHESLLSVPILHPVHPPPSSRHRTFAEPSESPRSPSWLMPISPACCHPDLYHCEFCGTWTSYLRITPFTCYSVRTCSCNMLTSQMGKLRHDF